MKKIRLAIIDDHVVVRMGLKFAIRLAADFEFAGERGGGEGAGDFVADCGADVTLLDIRMPRVDGIAALRDIRARNPDAKVVMLTTAGTDEEIYQALESGAKGYVLKDAGADPVIVAGDFNADKWRKEFAKERIFVLFEEAGCLDLLGLLPPDRRGTYPHKRYGDSSLDYIMVRGFESLGEPRIFPSEDLSDHCAFYGIIQSNLERNRQ